MPRNSRKMRQAQARDTDQRRAAAERRSSRQDSEEPRIALAQPSPLTFVSPAADRLRRARERTGLTLDVLVLRTKISRSMLEAVETMDLDRLPANTYTRGFVRAYAHEVGLDAEITGADYLVELGRKREVMASATPVAPQPAPRRRVRVGDLNRDVSGLTGLIVMLGCAAALIVYVWAAGGRESTPTAVTTSPPVESLAEPAAETTAHASSTPDAVPATSDSIQQGPFRLELHADRDCWVSATVDGRQALAQLLRKGEQATLEARESVVLRIGEPGALRYSIDGRTGRPLGPAGQPVTVRMTRDTLQAFISG